MCSRKGLCIRALSSTGRGELVDDRLPHGARHTRVPKMVAGDINAQVSGVRAGAEGLLRIVNRYGYDTFRNLVERMYDHGESVVPRLLPGDPRRRYVARGKWTTTASKPIPYRSKSRSRSRARRCVSIIRTRPICRRDRSTARCPRRCRRPASRSRCWRAAPRRQPRGISARSRWSPVRARCSTRSRPRRASCTAGRRFKGWR